MLIAQASLGSVSILNGDESNPNDVGPVFIQRTRNWKSLVNWALLTNYSPGLSEWWVWLLYLYSQVWTAGEDWTGDIRDKFLTGMARNFEEVR